MEITATFQSSAKPLYIPQLLIIEIFGLKIYRAYWLWFALSVSYKMRKNV